MSINIGKIIKIELFAEYYQPCEDATRRLGYTPAPGFAKSIAGRFIINQQSEFMTGAITFCRFSVNDSCNAGKDALPCPLSALPMERINYVRELKAVK